LILNNRASRSDTLTGLNASFGCDELNRLTTENRAGGGLTGTQTVSYQYNAIGNGCLPIGVRTQRPLWNKSANDRNWPLCRALHNIHYVDCAIMNSVFGQAWLRLGFVAEAMLVDSA
jgi:hypothetical protein